MVRRIITGGPADRSGQLGVDDRIIGVRQAGEREMTDIVSWRIEDVVNLIRGPKGSTVHLQILSAGAPSGAPRTLSLVRDRIDLDDQSASRRLLETRASDGSPTRVGRHRHPVLLPGPGGAQRGPEGLPQHQSGRPPAHRGVARRRASTALVVDLRDNQGGALDEALLVAGAVHRDRGPIVQIRKSSGRAQVKWDKDPFGGLGRAARRARESEQRIRFGDPGRSDPGLRAGARDRDADLRKGNRAEPRRPSLVRGHRPVEAHRLPVFSR